jgi:hypothetical protein
MITEFFGHYLDLSRLSYVSPMWVDNKFQPGTSMVIGRSLNIDICFGGNPVNVELFHQSLVFNEVAPEQAIEWAAKCNQIRVAVMNLVTDWLSVNNQTNVSKDFLNKLALNYPVFPTPNFSQSAPTDSATLSNQP